MNFFEKNKNKIVVFIFICSSVVSFFSFTVGVSAASTFCQCDNPVGDGGVMKESKEFPVENGNCEKLCRGGGTKSTANSLEEAKAEADAIDPAAGQNKGWMQEALEAVIRGLLNAVFVFVGWLVLIAVALLKWVLEPDTFTLFLNSDAIRDVWVMTRDFLNIGFIFVLLFSAFCTIFQVDKYHIKSIIFKLILMALLVNFSFPIARFIIDISNVTMYWLLNNIFEGMNDGAGLFASISGKTGIANILLPKSVDAYDIQYIIAAIIFSFIFGITLLIIAVMFVIRLIALGVIVMFSPIGFAGAAFPMASQYASKWWDALLKYSFFAPIMIFMLAVALKIMQATGNESGENNMGNAMLAAASSQTTDGDMATFISKAALFTIPIIVLWIGMGMAQTLSIAGAAAVTGKGKQFANWAGGKASGISFAKNAYKAYEGRRGQASADRLSNRLGTWAGGKPDQFMGAIGNKRADQRYQSGLAAQVADAAKLHDMTNKTENELKNVAQSGNKFAQAAAMMELASRGRTDKTKELDQVREKFGEESQVFRQMQNKVKGYDPASAFAYIKDDKERQDRIKEHVNSNQFDAKKLNSDALENAEFLGIAMENGSVKPGDLDELSKKSGKHAGNIKTSLATIADQDKLDVNGNVMRDAAGNAIKKYANMTDENHRNIHMAHLAAHGAVHSSLKTKAQRAELFKRLDKDNAKGLTVAEITGPYGSEMMEHVNTGKFKEIVSNMKSDAAKRAFVDNVKAMPMASAKRAALEKQIRRDAYLSSLW